MAVAKPLHLRLFLEGEEVPVIAAQISIGINAPSTAAIQVIPLDEAMSLYPRTMVHLFFLDNRASDSVSQVQGSKATGPVIDIRGQYRLLFSGEMIAFSSVQTPNSRGIVLQCVDFSSYWDSAHATAVEYGLGGNAFTNVGALYGGSVGTFDDIVNQQANQLLAWLHQKPETPGLTTVSGLAGGIIRIMEAMGGVPGHSKGINDFFTVAELRVRLLSQVTAEEGDDTALRVFGVGVFDEWIRNGLQNLGQQVTFRDMMKLLFQYIYYEFVPNPAPKFDAAITGTNSQVPGQVVRLSESPIASNVIDTLETDAEDILKKQSFVLSDAIRNEAQKYLDHCRQSSVSLRALRATSSRYSKGVTAALNKLTVAISILSKVAGPGDHNANELLPARTAMVDAADVINASSDQVQGPPTTITTGVSQRLRTQIVRPDCWFSAPPRCNIYFPEMYSQFSYDRNYLGEVTRSLIQIYNTLVGKDALLADRILAPSIGFQTIAKKANAGDYRLLMDHEIHTGIVPRTEWLPNIAAAGSHVTAAEKALVRGARLSWGGRISLWHFFKYRFATRTASVAGRFNPFVVCGFPAVIIKAPYILKGGVGQLQPFQVPVGQPQTLSDDQVLNLIDTMAPQLGAPTQFVGMIGGVSHNVDQSGGTTSVSLHHMRTHLGVDDEFLGLYLASLNGTTTRAVKTNLTFQNASAVGQDNLLNLLADATPQTKPQIKPKGKQRKVAQASAQAPVQAVNSSSGTVSSSSQTGNFNIIQEGDAIPPGDPPSLTIRGRIDQVNRVNILVPSPHGKVVAGTKNGFYAKQGATVLGVEVLDATIHKTKYGQAFGAVAIYENISVAIGGTIPIEEVIRPRWFSNAYSNVLIGKKIYQPFFGCDSIVDDLNVNGLVSQSPVPGAPNDPDVSSFSSDTSPQDVINQLVQDEANKNLLSISRAINILGYVYGQVKTQVPALDIDDFIRSYIDRPIATISQIFGSVDLELGVDQNTGLVTATKGTVGFHTGAVNAELAAVGGLVGIAQDLSLNLKRINGVGASSPLVTKYDVRPSNKSRVIAYVTALTKGPGFRG